MTRSVGPYPWPAVEQVFTSHPITMIGGSESCQKHGSHKLGHMPGAGGEEEWFSERREGRGSTGRAPGVPL